ncbi:MAG: ABC transporter permease [Candidatus Helarchaeota archaeon]|nr:ABC transporter permease [Candidatus Helarchaeota archaeon]
MVKSELRVLSIILERDLRSFTKYSWWLIGLVLMNLADLFILATTLTKITIGLNYFLYFTPGITMLATFSSAFLMGREVNEEKRYGRDQYLLALPLTRSTFIFGRTLAGAIRGILYSVSLLVLAILFTSTSTIISDFSIGFVLIPNRTFLDLVILFFISLGIIFLISLGMSGFSIAIGTSIKKFENYALSRSFASLWLMFGSTVYYPREKMPEIMAIFSDFNPLSYGVNILRSLLFILPIRVIDILGLIIFAISMLFLCYFTYNRATQGE